MAKRNPHSRNRNSNNSRILALLILLALLVVIIWLTRSTPAPKINKDNLDRAMLTQSQANKELKDSTPPGGTTDIQVDPAGLPPPANESQNAAVESQNAAVESPKLAQQQEKKPVKTPLVQPDKPPVQQQSENQANQPSGEADKLFASGKAAFEAKDYLKARDNLSDAVKMGLSHDQDQQARQMLNAAADQWLFSRSTFGLDEFCRRHKVAAGERLANIGKNYDVPYELIQRMNNISNPNILRAEQTIKVVQGPFHALVELSKFRLSVFLGDVLVRTYPISIGISGRETPTGLWRVMVKQPNPVWTDPETNKTYLPDDPDNPLGERWIGLEGLEGEAVDRTGIGIHGTIIPDEIGTATSRGCIRLHNGDVRELYDLLVISKSRIRVVK